MPNIKRTFLNKTRLVISLVLLFIMAPYVYADTFIDVDFTRHNEGFSYRDDTFRDTLQPYYAKGAWLATKKCLRVSLGGMDSVPVEGMSGGWTRAFNLTQPTEVVISFKYKLSQAANYDYDEYSEVLVSVDGVLYGKDGYDYVDKLIGDGSGGAQQTNGWGVFRVNIGVLGVGRHELIVGGYNNKKDISWNYAEILIDNVLVTGQPFGSPNTPPVANDRSITTTKGVSVVMTVTGNDVDGDPLAYTILTRPTNGNLNGIAPNLIYIPNDNFSGADSFTFKVNDGTVDSNTAVVNINVMDIVENLPPVSNSQFVVTTKEDPVSITLTASDPDNDVLSYSIVIPPVNGSLSGTAPNLTYTPNTNFTGSDRFTFKVNDGTVDSNTAVVNINVSELPAPTETEIKITWVYENPPSDLAGFTIHIGEESGKYDRTINVSKNSNSFIIPDLIKGKTYYFATTAFDIEGNRSIYSGEIIATVPSSVVVIIKIY